jgi:hypothetical protein
MAPVARKSFSQLDDLPAELARRVEGRLPAQVLEIVLVQPHPVEFPAEAALELGVLRGRRLAVRGHEAQNVEDLVRVGDITLVQREMVLEERLAEPGHADELGIVFGGVIHDLSLLWKNGLPYSSGQGPGRRPGGPSQAGGFYEITTPEHGSYPLSTKSYQ